MADCVDLAGVKLAYKKPGVFRPKQLDNLRDEAKAYIGQELLFTYAGTMDQDEAFANQKTYTARMLDGREVRMGWVPEEDVEWS